MSRECRRLEEQLIWELVLHLLYHAGQVALLKRALGLLPGQP